MQLTVHLLAVLLLLYGTATAQGTKSTDAFVLQAADKLEQKCLAWRRDFHRHPELGNKEVRTARIIADHLKALGLEVQEGIAHTGVVGILKGGKPGPVVALRADMDALPVTEETGLPFASKEKTIMNGQNVGVMHACGHDAHMAMLLSTAEILSSMKADLPGTVKFIFQPAEEGVPFGEEGGAKLMIKEGVLERPKVDAVFGLHVNAQTPLGQIKYRPGGIMAASDWFVITIKGKQAHGAQPWLGIDPVVVGAQIVNSLQTIVSRQTELTKNAVVISTTIFNGGVRENIIPEKAVLSGTIRTLDKKMRADVLRRITNTVTHIAEASGATAEVAFHSKTAVLYNDPALMQQVLPSLERAANGNVVEMDATTQAEDFSYFSEQVPSVFVFLGARPAHVDEAASAPHHTPRFFIDEDSMKTGIKAFCFLVLDYLTVSKKK